MHELSIIYSVVSTVTKAVADQGGGQVISVRLRVGALAGVERDSLLFGYDLATQGTPLAGSVLEIEDVPVRIYCSSCACEQTLVGVQSFRCPVCGRPSGDFRSGRELAIESVEIETPQSEQAPC
ncbi:hydrogenase nickel incorporation protein HypA/HybF [Bryocella elongata]|uniref:Hydrogenase maturation factor HypA n=1 Tax=Bryocella elongata TaxID=863522 RepID=A0A1H6CAX9_9BACT|nr:hydrogenase maturation nickel metallochaperone HypA [Bryocella elongata]SEG70058.1 hydrogenase nickel incorporation protein HypA/HybF [Bryocella elongata]